MNELTVYLTFNGNCKEAMLFYKDCLGGELGFQMVGETPKTQKLPEKMKNLVVHATLKSGNKVLMGTDLMDDDGLKTGNSMAIHLECRTRAEMETVYKKLARDGLKTHRITETFWGAFFGGLTDRYGHCWLLYCQTRGVVDGSF